MNDISTAGRDDDGNNGGDLNSDDKIGDEMPLRPLTSDESGDEMPLRPLTSVGHAVANSYERNRESGGDSDLVAINATQAATSADQISAATDQTSAAKMAVQTSAAYQPGTSFHVYMAAPRADGSNIHVSTTSITSSTNPPTSPPVATQKATSRDGRETIKETGSASPTDHHEQGGERLDGSTREGVRRRSPPHPPGVSKPYNRGPYEGSNSMLEKLGGRNAGEVAQRRGGSKQRGHEFFETGMRVEEGWGSASTASGSWYCSTGRPNTRHHSAIWRAMTQQRMKQVLAADRARRVCSNALAHRRAQGATSPSPARATTWAGLPNNVLSLEELNGVEEEKTGGFEPLADLPERTSDECRYSNGDELGDEVTQVFPKNARVEYLTRAGGNEWVSATVMEVAFDDEMVEYYEVNLDHWNDSTRSKSTEGRRLRLPAKKETAEVEAAVIEEVAAREEEGRSAAAAEGAEKVEAPETNGIDVAGGGGGEWDDSMPNETEEVLVEEVKVPQLSDRGEAKNSNNVKGQEDDDDSFAHSAPILRRDGGSSGGGGTAASANSLRAPVNAFFSGLAGGGMDLGVTAAGGYSICGGADSGERARELFCGRALPWTPARQVFGDVRQVDFEDLAVDVFFATPRAAGVTSRSRGEQVAAAALYMANVRAILCSGALVGVIESDYGVTLVSEAKFFREMINAADQGGYAVRFRHVKPHLFGGAQMRPRLFVLLVRKDVLEAAGEPPKVSAKPASQRGPALTVRSVLEPGLVRREVKLGEVRFRKVPEKVGVCSRVGFVGRGGISGSVWDVDAAAPGEVSPGKSSLFFLDGKLIRLTAREEARLRGIPDEVDIREAAGPMTSKRFVHSSPSVFAVQAVAQDIREYVHDFRSVGKKRREAVVALLDKVERVEEKEREAVEVGVRDGSDGRRCGSDDSFCNDDDDGTEPPLRVRLWSDGRPQACSKRHCEVCDRLNEKPMLCNAVRKFASRCSLFFLKREAATLGEDEQQAARRVVADHLANHRGWKYVSRDGGYVCVPVRNRTPVFWRWRRPSHRAMLRDGAPLYLAHERVEPTRTTNYSSGSGEVARDFIRGLENDGIVERISNERAEELKAKGASINPLAMIEKKLVPGQPQKYRMLLDCFRSGVNMRIGAMPSKFPEVIHAIKSVCSAGSWTFCSDFVDMFYSWVVSSEEGELYLIQTLDGYFIFRRLAQGSKSSPHVSLKLIYGAMEEFIEERGSTLPRMQVPGESGFDPEAPPVIFEDERGRSSETCVWMDDAIASQDTEQESFEMMIEYLKFFERRGMHIAYPKLELPAQRGRTFGGYEIVTVRGRLEVRLKEPARVQTHAAVLGALAASGVPSRDLATIAGLLERAAALDVDTRAWVHRLYDFARGRRGVHWWEERSIVTKEMRKDLRHWAQILAKGLVAHIVRERKTHIFWGDSSGTRSGGCVRTASGVVSAWTARWPKALVAQARGSNYLELRCVLVQLQRLVKQLEETGECEVKGGFIILFTDNEFTETVLQHGTACGDATSAIIRAIRKASARLGIKLLVLHVAGTRLIAQGTDGLSRREGPASEGEELDTQSWTAGLAPAKPTDLILNLVDDVFGARTLACSPLRAGTLAGQRWVVFPHPWHAHFWAETAKVAQVIEPFTTDIVFVLPSRARALWTRSFRGFIQIARVRAGECGELWPAEEHEALYFFHMPRWIIPSPCRDKYFAKRADSALKREFAAQREAEGGGEVTRHAALFQRHLMEIAERASSAEKVARANAANYLKSTSAAELRDASDRCVEEVVRAHEAEPLESSLAAARQAWKSTPTVATPDPPASAAESRNADPPPRALGVTKGMRAVRPLDNVPFLVDPRGNPYLISEDGSFWRSEASGGGPVAFTKHDYCEIVRELDELGLLGTGPAPVLVQPDGSESSPLVPPATN